MIDNVVEAETFEIGFKSSLENASFLGGRVKREAFENGDEWVSLNVLSISVFRRFSMGTIGERASKYYAFSKTHGCGQVETKQKF